MNTAATIIAILAIAFLTVGIWATVVGLSAWILMLVLGGLANMHVLPITWALGFWACVLINFFIGIIAQPFRGSK